ncbi:MAG: hypothetical protein US86_C0001G0313 [Candidatus Daviesbacteria bacterium GW2011_GWA2_38_24]|uniref:Uncharacterized protein n=1 Tax=Candidatus Daviesbacteria bacterium GW2011_GWA2_38_24 TaxID=1618422 RepID=A0A0G0MR23_9BACT|nr:MAG: hypothetical protein US86_C0001G0313 [Candidatus Daviesbacteria bacterium GW2011_GWA2_38_24]KKQ79934.1 MAG: hypothetical protein UT01_C0024G0015 [Candidatus Daviesbacteria bacterium GW2011_GWA1_38_7]
MSKLSLKDKKLETLTRQLSGKHVKYNFSNNQQLSKKSFSSNSNNPLIIATDTSFLKTDLLKIFILSALAISFELIIYWLIQKQLILS